MSAGVTGASPASTQSSHSNGWMPSCSEFRLPAWYVAVRIARGPKRAPGTVAHRVVERGPDDRHIGPARREARRHRSAAGASGRWCCPCRRAGRNRRRRCTDRRRATAAARRYAHGDGAVSSVMVRDAPPHDGSRGRRRGAEQAWPVCVELDASKGCRRGRGPLPSRAPWPRTELHPRGGPRPRSAGAGRPAPARGREAPLRRCPRLRCTPSTPPTTADPGHADVEAPRGGAGRGGRGNQGPAGASRDDGVQVRDLESGLVDIPGERDGLPRLASAGAWATRSSRSGTRRAKGSPTASHGEGRP